jgi:hypothetical protein
MAWYSEYYSRYWGIGATVKNNSGDRVYVLYDDENLPNDRKAFHPNGHHNKYVNIGVLHHGESTGDPKWRKRGADADAYVTMADAAKSIRFDAAKGHIVLPYTMPVMKTSDGYVGSIEKGSNGEQVTSHSWIYGRWLAGKTDVNEMTGGNGHYNVATLDEATGKSLVDDKVLTLKQLSDAREKGIKQIWDGKENKLNPTERDALDKLAADVAKRASNLDGLSPADLEDLKIKSGKLAGYLTGPTAQRWKEAVSSRVDEAVASQQHHTMAPAAKGHLASTDELPIRAGYTPTHPSPQQGAGRTL